MRAEYILFIMVSAMAIILAMILPADHDYIAYNTQWKMIREGLDPYFQTDNAYGITYNYFAYLNGNRIVRIPRTIFIITYLYATYLIWRSAKHQTSQNAIWVLIILLLNPLFWIFSIKYGSNDSFLAGITIIALIAYLKQHQYLAGLLFAVGFCFKFTPIFIIPFFLVSKTKVNFKVAGAFVISAIIIYSAGYIQWGSNIVEPFLFGESRVSKIFSIFRFIRGEVQPLGFLNIKTLDGYSVYIMLTSVVLVFLAYFYFNLNRYLAALLSLSTALLFYKVGHHQFYILLLMLTVLVVIVKCNVIQQHAGFVYLAVIFFSWIFFFTILYHYTWGYGHNFNLVRTWVGLPTFIMHTVMNVYLIKVMQSDRKLSLQNVN